MNHVTLIGNLGADPDVRITSTGKQVATMRVATTEGRGDSAITDWHTVVAWERLAEGAMDLRKGARVVVVGKLKTRSWEDQRTGSKRFVVEVVASSLSCEPSTRGLTSGGQAPSAPPPPSAPARQVEPPASRTSEPDYFDDDVPF